MLRPDPKIILICWLMGMMAVPVLAQKYKPTWESLDSRPIPKWFNEAKFGIFIHWGVYSVPAWRPLSQKKYASYAEWYYARVIDDLKNGGDAFHRKNFGNDFEYRQFGPMFRAELFDPDFWADLFKKAGARYVVLTSKHHDGYCLWPTSSPYKTDWNSEAVGPQRDLLGDLAKSVRKAGLKMGLYYSIIEWESIPTKRVESGWYINKKTVDKYRIPLENYVDDHLLPQLRELVTLYQPSLIFSDGGEWDFDENFWKTKEFLAWLYNRAPNKDEVVVNDRWCKGMPGVHGDYFSSEYQDTDAVGVSHPWEESRGIGGSYGFNRAENLEDYRSSEELVHELIDIAHRGGNLLLNVGPTADGRIPVIMQQRLIDIGEWLRINGDAIYGTQTWSPTKSLPAEESSPLRFTQKGNDIFVHCLVWPTDDITVPTAGLRPSTIRLLGADKPVEWEPTQDGIRFRPPQLQPHEIPCRYAYVFKMEGIVK